MLDQLRDVFPEEREWRVGNHNVCLLKQSNAFGAAEVAVTLEVSDRDLVKTWDSITVLVAFVLQVDRSVSVVLAEQVSVLVFVACGDQLLQSKFFEVVREIVEEVAGSRIVAVAVDDLSIEVFLVMSEFFFDVAQLRVELIFTTGLRGR